LGVPWEENYGYPQARQVGNDIYVSGQFNHDEGGNLVAPAIEWRGQAQRFFLDGGTDAHGLRQHRQIACSLRCDTLEDVVEETLYVLDMDAAFDVVGKVRKAAYGSERPQCASTIVAVPRLAQRSQLIEIARKAVIGARTH